MGDALRGWSDDGSGEGGGGMGGGGRQVAGAGKRGGEGNEWSAFHGVSSAHCSALQHTVALCNTDATRATTGDVLSAHHRATATHCNTVPHPATPCNSARHGAPAASCQTDVSVGVEDEFVSVPGSVSHVSTRTGSVRVSDVPMSTDVSAGVQDEFVGVLGSVGHVSMRTGSVGDMSMPTDVSVSVNDESVNEEVMGKREITPVQIRGLSLSLSPRVSVSLP